MSPEGSYFNAWSPADDTVLRGYGVCRAVVAYAFKPSTQETEAEAVDVCEDLRAALTTEKNWEERGGPPKGRTH